MHSYRAYCETQIEDDFHQREVVARAVDGSDAPDWPKYTNAIWPFLGSIAGVSETAMHLQSKVSSVMCKLST